MASCFRLKKLHNLQVESYVLFSRFSEDFKPGRRDSWIVLRDCFKEVREEPGYIGVLQQNQVVGTSKVDFSLKKTRHLKLMNLAFFYVWEDAKV